MKVLLHKIKNQKQTAIKIPAKRNIKIQPHKKGYIILKVPYRATSQNRIIVDLEGKRVEAWID